MKIFDMRRELIEQRTRPRSGSYDYDARIKALAVRNHAGYFAPLRCQGRDFRAFDQLNTCASYRDFERVHQAALLVGGGRRAADRGLEGQAGTRAMS